MANLAVVILAAGKGTRLRSSLPKALHPICGKPMIWFLLEKAKALNAKKTVVVTGYKSELLKPRLGPNVKAVLQKELLGSGHALAQTEKALSGFKGSVLVLYCDTPLIGGETLRSLLKKHQSSSADITLLSVKMAKPFSYGRVLRSSAGLIQKIVEENDASAEEKLIDEVNVGCYVFSSEKIFKTLKQIKKNPLKKEYYLTDVVELMAKTGKVESVEAKCFHEVRGINTRQDLAAIQKAMQRRILDDWMDKGVEIRDPNATWIEAGVTLGEGTVVYPSTLIEEDSKVGKDCRIGPFARIRGGSTIQDNSVIGNFVEIVRSKIGKHTQVKHLSYLGDAVLGDSVNVGAGCITANYDGKNKHQTLIKDKASLGSGTILVAPVTIGRAAVTGAGTVVTKGSHVPDGSVVVGVPAKKIKSTAKGKSKK